MTRLALAAGALLFATAAVAQGPVLDPQRFAPLDAGNRWEYTLTTNSGPGPVVTGYLVSTVDGETTVGGAPYTVLSRQSFGPTGAPTSARATCAYSRTLGTAPAGSTQLPDYDCANQPALPPALPYSSGPTTLTANADVTVASQTVRVDSLVTFGRQAQGSGGAYDAVVWTYATEIGNVGFRNWGNHHWAAGGGTYDTRTTLTFVRVAGRTVGGSVVAGETQPEAATSLRLSAAPNPSAGVVRIAAVGAVGVLSVDVFDALGRRVDGGAVPAGSAVTFEPATAGVYVVRATDAAGQVATQRVVRR